jgi:type I restriction enzyme R subunit
MDPDVIAQRATGRPGASPSEVKPEVMKATGEQLAKEACAPFDVPALRDALCKSKQEAEQTIDNVTVDTVLSSGFDAAAKEKAASLMRSFREYIELHKAEIGALQILYSRPYKQRLTEAMLKELERKLREQQAAWTEDRLWDSFALGRAGEGEGAVAGGAVCGSGVSCAVFAGAAAGADAI